MTTEWEEPTANDLAAANRIDELDDDKDVKDDWEIDSEDERQKEAEKEKADAIARAERAAAKKPTEAKLAEKNREREERVQQALKDEAAARRDQPQTAAELQVEKEEQMKRQRDADFEFTRELMTTRVSKLSLGTHANPTEINRVELAEMRQQLLNVLSVYEPNPEYNGFAHELIVALATSLPSDRIKDIAADLNAMSLQKKKDEKEVSKKYQKSASVVGKKGVKGLSKVNDMLDDFSGDSHAVQYGNDDDDFM